MGFQFDIHATRQLYPIQDLTRQHVDALSSLYHLLEQTAPDTQQACRGPRIEYKHSLLLFNNEINTVADRIKVTSFQPMQVLETPHNRLQIVEKHLRKVPWNLGSIVASVKSLFNPTWLLWYNSGERLGWTSDNFD